ncbi:unnamed protein product [Euphydryas editha]|uniref:Uncharacterized protein n=1 Tax=Euphydryas editha TaxID=104508 RepID=A0AAU9TM53_EUPED|nr:unnamed protein product [Euphydryas editha]
MRALGELKFNITLVFTERAATVRETQPLNKNETSPRRAKLSTLTRSMLSLLLVIPITYTQDQLQMRKCDKTRLPVNSEIKSSLRCQKPTQHKSQQADHEKQLWPIQTPL